MNDEMNLFHTNENETDPGEETVNEVPEETVEETAEAAAESVEETVEETVEEAREAAPNAYPYGASSAYPYTQPGTYPYGAPGSAYRDQTDPGRPQNPYQQQNPYRQNPYQQNPYQQQDPYRQQTPYNGQQSPYAGRNPYAYTRTEEPPKKSKAGRVIVALLAVLALLVGVGVFFAVRGAVRRLPENPSNPGNEGREQIENVSEVATNPTPVFEPVVGPDGTLDPTEIYKKILPSSVGVLVYSKSTGQLISEGSGVIYMADETGDYTYIVTCAHVIKGSSRNIMVQLSTNEKEYEATVIGYDSRTDIGVLRIRESGLTAAEIGDSDKLIVGETVYAIGNPGGTEFAFTFTNGIVTALDRPVSSSSTGYTMECIQHNVAINPGNSGGALVNRFGQLIGINSMKIVAADYEGMGFSVPSSVFVKVVNELVAKGYVTSRPKIGISYVNASNEQAYAMFVAIKGLPAGSIVIASVSEDSDLYGKLEVGDLVTAINGKDLDSATDLAAYVETMKVGDPITLKVVRIKKDYTFTEHTITGVLVEDKEAPETEEETTSYFDDYFGRRDNGGSSGDSGDSEPYNPYSDDFFRDFYDRFFGGSNP